MTKKTIELLFKKLFFLIKIPVFLIFIYLGIELFIVFSIYFMKILTFLANSYLGVLFFATNGIYFIKTSVKTLKWIITISSIIIALLILFMKLIGSTIIIDTITKYITIAEQILDKFIYWFILISDFLYNNFWGSFLLFLLLGIYGVIDSIKNPHVLSYEVRGWVASVMSIIVAFYLLICKIMGEI